MTRRGPTGAAVGALRGPFSATRQEPFRVARLRAHLRRGRRALLAAQSQRVQPVREREARQRARQGSAQPRPGWKPDEGPDERPEEPPGPHLEPVHQARGRVELAGDHAEPQRGRPPAQDRQPAEERAEHDERRAARDGEHARPTGAAAAPGPLAGQVALPEAEPRPGGSEGPPPFLDEFDHGCVPTTRVPMLARRGRRAPVRGHVSRQKPFLAPMNQVPDPYLFSPAPTRRTSVTSVTLERIMPSPTSVPI